jgi:hypothetical protein
MYGNLLKDLIVIEDFAQQNAQRNGYIGSSVTLAGLRPEEILKMRNSAHRLSLASPLSAICQRRYSALKFLFSGAGSLYIDTVLYSQPFRGHEKFQTPVQITDSI